MNFSVLFICLKRFPLDKERLKKLAKAIEADRVERAQTAAVTTPAGMSALVAAQVAAALSAFKPAQ